MAVGTFSLQLHLQTYFLGEVFDHNEDMILLLMYSSNDAIVPRLVYYLLNYIILGETYMCCILLHINNGNFEDFVV